MMNFEAPQVEYGTPLSQQDTISVVQGGPDQEGADRELQEILYATYGELSIAERIALTHEGLVSQEIENAATQAVEHAQQAIDEAEAIHVATVARSTEDYEGTSTLIDTNQERIRQQARAEQEKADQDLAEKIRIAREEHARESRRIEYARMRQHDQEELDRIDARLRHEKEVDASQKAFEELVERVIASREKKLEKLENESKSNTDFFEKCRQIIATISKGIDMHHEAHDEATSAIRLGFDNLAKNQADIIFAQEELSKLVERHDELLRDYEGRERSIALMRAQLPKLMREMTDKSDQAYRSLEETRSRDPDAINSALNEEMIFRNSDAEIINRHRLVEEEIIKAKEINAPINAEISRLHNLIESFKAEISILREQQVEYEQEIANQQAKREALIPTASALQDRVDILHRIEREGPEALTTIPFEFRQLARAAFSTKIADPEDEYIPDHAASIPGFDNPTIKIEIPFEELPIIHMAGIAINETVTPTEEASDLRVLFKDKVLDANAQFEVVRSWLRDHMGDVAEAMHVTPAGLMTQGAAVRVKVKNN